MEVEITLRRWQEELKDKIIEALRDNKLVVLQAPTGSGKTLFALITALALNKRVLIVTRTINEYDPIVRELHRLGIYDYTLLVGKEKGCLILGEERLKQEEEKKKQRTLESIFSIKEEEEKEEKIAKNPICSKCYYYESYGVVTKDLTVFNKLGYYYAKKRDEIAKKRRENEEERERLWEEYYRHDICPYRSLLRDAKSSKIIVGTYAYLFKYLDQLRNKEEPLDTWLSNIVVIIDEAHNLENIHTMDDKIIKKEHIEKARGELERHNYNITNIYTEVKSLTELVLKVRKVKEGEVEEIEEEEVEEIEENYEEEDNEREIIDSIIDNAINTLNELYNKIPDKEYTKLYKLEKEPYKLRYKELEALGDAINHLITEKRAYTNYTMYVAEALKMIHNSNTRVYSNGKDIEVKVIDPSYLLSILNKDIPILAMSGTMPSKDYMVNVYGIKEDRIVEFDISKRKDIRPLIFKRIHTDLTTEYKNRNDSMYKKYADRIVEISNNAEKSVLVMFSSYDMLNKIASYLPREFKILKEYRRSSIKKFQNMLIEIAEKNSKAIILVVARGKMTEGIEFVYNGRSLISDIVIVGVPYKPYDDYIKDSIGFINNKLGKEGYKIMLEEIYIAVKQCIGRAVRSNGDSAKVWLLDKRFKNRFWKFKL